MMVALPAMAKKGNNARKVLDQMSAKITASGGIKAGFSVTAFVGKQSQGTEHGTFLTDGQRFQMTTSSLITWYDGKTQWSYFKQTEEVNVAEPTESELQTMNPYAFLSIYKKGFTYTMQDASYLGKTVHEITLIATNKKQDIQRILLTVDKTTLLPLCVRILQGSKNWTRINVNRFQGNQKFSTDTFRFNAKKYPNAEVIDLR